MTSTEHDASGAIAAVEAGFGSATSAALQKTFEEAGCTEQGREERMQEGALERAYQFIEMVEQIKR